MPSTLQAVKLGDISLIDRSFVVTEGRDTTILQGSIASVGLLQPPRLWRPGPDEPYRTVCGYLRVAALRNLGCREISAWVFDPETPAARLLECALLDNLGHRLFNPVEKAHALQRLLACLPRDAVIEQWLPRFGLSPSARLLERTVCLCALEQEVRAALIEGSLTEASALRLCACGAGDRLAVFALMRQLHLSAGKQAELLECLEDLARRAATTLREAAGDVDIARVCSDERLNRVQRTEQVRRILRARRFPRLQAAEARFAAALKDTHIGEGIRITPPPNFEGRGFRAEIAFASADELSRRSRELLLAAETESFARVCGENGGGAHADDNPR